MTTVREFTQMLLDLPANQQDLPFLTCLGHSPECDLEAPRSLYAQPETYREVGADPEYPNRVRHVVTGKIEHIHPSPY